jgi:hypothetical protein
MISSIERIELGEVADLLDPPQIRKGGWHVTNLIAEAIAISKGRRAPAFDPPENIWGLISMGRIWEPVVKPWLTQYAEMVGFDVVYGTQEKPLEAVKDEILGNLDAVLYSEDEVVAIVDMKFTMGKADMMLNTSREKYLHQMKAYCSMMGCTEAWFLTLNIPKGGGLSCDFYKQQFVFTQEEVDHTWTMIRKTKEYLESIGEKADAE